MVDKIWASFKTIFAEEYHELVEETNVNTGDASFHLANAIKEIWVAIKHLSMAADDNKDIVTKLIEAVEQLKNNNVSLTM